MTMKLATHSNASAFQRRGSGAGVAGARSAGSGRVEFSFIPNMTPPTARNHRGRGSLI
jgi:hypothetical protein